MIFATVQAWPLADLCPHRVTRCSRGPPACWLALRLALRGALDSQNPCCAFLPAPNMPPTLCWLLAQDPCRLGAEGGLDMWTRPFHLIMVLCPPDHSVFRLDYESALSWRGGKNPSALKSLPLHLSHLILPISLLEYWNTSEITHVCPQALFPPFLVFILHNPLGQKTADSSFYPFIPRPPCYLQPHG